MRRGVLVAVIALAGCDAPAVDVDAEDGDVDTSLAEDTPAADALPETVVVDTKDPTYTLPDGRVCSGHDEDRDFIPDDCDDCPGFPDPEQRTVPAVVGNACKALLPFDAARRRLFFDPFTEFRGYNSFADGEGVFEIDATGERLLGGIGSDEKFRFVLRQPPPAGPGVDATATTTVVTTVFDKRPLGLGGHQSAGILLRAGGAPQRFLYCFRGESVVLGGIVKKIFGIAIAPPSGCNGGPCTPIVLVSKGIPAELVPGEKVEEPLGLRASITSGVAPATTGTMECRVFDPAPTVTHAVHNGDPNYTVTMALDETQWISSGVVGLAAFGCHVEYRWLDVLDEVNP